MDDKKNVDVEGQWDQDSQDFGSKENDILQDLMKYAPVAQSNDKAVNGFGSYVRLLRQSKRLTIAQLADKAGIPADIIDDFEGGLFSIEEIDIFWIYKIANVLGDNHTLKNRIIHDLKMFTGQVERIDLFPTPHDHVIFWVKTLFEFSAVEVGVLVQWLEYQKRSGYDIGSSIVLLVSVELGIPFEKITADLKQLSNNLERATFDRENVSTYDLVRYWVSGYGKYTEIISRLITEHEEACIPVGQMFLTWSRSSICAQIRTSPAPV